MARYSAGQLEKCLDTKLKAERQSNKDHRVYIVYDDSGAIIARTKVSHSWRPSDTIPPKIVSLMRTQLKLSTMIQFEKLVLCPMSREEYLAIARD